MFAPEKELFALKTASENMDDGMYFFSNV